MLLRHVRCKIRGKRISIEVSKKANCYIFQMGYRRGKIGTHVWQCQSKGKKCFSFFNRKGKKTRIANTRANVLHFRPTICSGRAFKSGPFVNFFRFHFRASVFKSAFMKSIWWGVKNFGFFFHCSNCFRNMNTNFLPQNLCILFSWLNSNFFSANNVRKSPVVSQKIYAREPCEIDKGK